MGYPQKESQDEPLEKNSDLASKIETSISQDVFKEEEYVTTNNITSMISLNGTFDISSYERYADSAMMHAILSESAETLMNPFVSTPQKGVAPPIEVDFLSEWSCNDQIGSDFVDDYFIDKR